MKCPSCKNEMRVEVVDGISVDTCPTCAGLWFDWMEFKKFDEEHETRAEKLLVLNEGPKKNSGPQLRCPKCPQIIMRRFFSSVLRQVEIDECAKCGGIWLDAGELMAIRQEFKTEEERKAAAAKNLGAMFDREMALPKAKSQERNEQLREIKQSGHPMVKLVKAIAFMIKNQANKDRY